MYLTTGGGEFVQAVHEGPEPASSEVEETATRPAVDEESAEATRVATCPEPQLDSSGRDEAAADSDVDRPQAAGLDFSVDEPAAGEMNETVDEPTDESTCKTTDEPEDESKRAPRPNFLTATRFSDFDLPPEIMAGLDAAGFDSCTPIQAQVIPVALDGHDVAGQAQTGTGKTAAFLVPVLTRLLRRPPMLPGLPRALVITPTRELAVQIFNDAKVLASDTALTQTLVIGGVEYREQAEALQAGADLVVCTPGRIIDYLMQGVFVPRAVEAAVVDEADRLLDMGFIKDLKLILSKLPPYDHRQTMLFSATLDDRVLELTYQYMNPPQYITAEPDHLAKAQIDQSLYHLAHNEKLPLLLGLLRREEHSRVIIFCNTKSGVEWLTKKLTLNGWQAEGITGDLPQPKRLKLMEAFKQKRLQIMVATDVASRGIHVEDVSHVYNYDLPQDAENYIHRIGRTARAGKSGKAVSFACEDHVFHLEAIENILGDKIPVIWVDDDMLDVDVAGDVRTSDRRPRARAGRPSFGGDRRPSEEPRRHGPVKTTRPGGIFGLAPRSPLVEGQPNPRQVLSWSLDDLEESGKRQARRGAGPEAGSSVLGFSADKSTSGESAGAAQTQRPASGQPQEERLADQPREARPPSGDRDGRRRKRRRGRGPREIDDRGQAAVAASEGAAAADQASASVSTVDCLAQNAAEFVEAGLIEELAAYEPGGPEAADRFDRPAEPAPAAGLADAAVSSAAPPEPPESRQWPESQADRPAVDLAAVSAEQSADQLAEQAAEAAVVPSAVVPSTVAAAVPEAVAEAAGPLAPAPLSAGEGESHCKVAQGDSATPPPESFAAQRDAAAVVETVEAPAEPPAKPAKRGRKPKAAAAAEQTPAVEPAATAEQTPTAEPAPVKLVKPRGRPKKEPEPLEAAVQASVKPSAGRRKKTELPAESPAAFPEATPKADRSLEAEKPKPKAARTAKTAEPAEPQDGESSGGSPEPAPKPRRGRKKAAE
ncbi:MAG: DEAD/DEAH box helicase [Deltaproteobacteria bacterium]|jgi:ATP-dependent RNA helicase RhlB|nr:DEAD/DEAH box helicase [Deltaproteobacteria bacterium]